MHTGSDALAGAAELAALTSAERRALQVIEQHLRRYAVPPSFRELAAALGAGSSNTATRLVAALERKGWLRRRRGLQRTLALTRPPDDGIPIVGFVPAGVPVDAAEIVEDRLVRIDDLFGTRPDFLLRVRGHSMRDAGILDGDLVGIAKAAQARSGQIVVARVDGEVTLKRLKLLRNKALLLPENPDYRPLTVALEELTIEGVFVGIIRKS
ncbi:MAG: transcriptional repressor LexA [Gammaproteobacteria bacterium]|nr:transcriptional repressor LexA [Gammaproteobacteria bacterium]